MREWLYATWPEGLDTAQILASGKLVAGDTVTVRYFKSRDTVMKCYHFISIFHAMSRKDYIREEKYEVVSDGGGGLSLVQRAPDLAGE